MKKSLVLWTLTMVFVLGTLLAQEVSKEVSQAIKKEICKQMRVMVKPVADSGLSQVFDASFYQVSLSRQDPGGGIYGMGSLILARKGKGFLVPEDIPTDKLMPVLKSLVKDNFRLKSLKEAELIQQALGVLYPVKSISDRKVIGIKQKGDQWYFIRGKFFDKSKGFVITVQQDKIIEIKYSLGIKLE